ncbi:hypothetical protein [Hymenobacter lapidarius]|uniref:beta-xylosidase family glycoside hydrolase n=1 Tax=Hymenobacter lapidarius TaxID=1908237 RepID=UPI001EFADBCA|nr:hypothetical protein [Hymenobacter lapidarius]
MLHHAYEAGSHEFAGRQGVLSEFEWTAAGWPAFRGKSTPVAAPAVAARASAVADEFTGRTLDLAWQWPVEYRPTFAVSGGQLRLTARPDHSGAALGRSTTAAAYTATTTLLNPGTLAAGTRAGLAAHGDPDNTLMLVASAGKVQLLQLEKGQTKTLAEVPLPATKALELRLQARQGSQFSFAWRTTGGPTWQTLPASGAPVDGRFLPPWDRGVRVGVVAQGAPTGVAVFENFTLTAQP